ncbi:ornithine cyclodeaminase [Streptomyces sp. WI04-05B]|uniref:ornithine cyclodeaminase n=1 Tax=Streptomyces TaxID=1883 RepID=UPI0029B2BA86|nr:MULTISPECIES: ornithine cyclodeaminase [unclassified Streptomyces]MDX2547313.1 ornithine cyclodeaminase [Streptomyces sp. WI04-05B]MDX2589801.1 ornithine cyclodeaminase [Streptomyces sp. WI04-05A]
MTDSPMPSLTYLSSTDVTGICAGLPVVDIVEDTLRAVHARTAGLTPEAALRWATPTGAAARSLILPGWSGDAYGCKIINASLGNHRFGLPRAAGLVVLNDPETARPAWVMEGGLISALRTAGVSLAAVRALRDPDSVTEAAFIGCGRQAEVHLDLLLRTCAKLSEVVLYDHEAGRARRLAAALGTSAPHLTVSVAADARDAAGRAGLVVAVTTATTPYVELDWLSAGSIFVNVSLDDAAESLLLGCDALFVDDWQLVAEDEHRLLGKLARAGRVSGPGEPAPEGGRSVDATLPALVSGEFTRPLAATDRVVVNPFGMGVHDIAVAAAVRDRAVEQGLGLTLPH